MSAGLIRIICTIFQNATEKPSKGVLVGDGLSPDGRPQPQLLLPAVAAAGGVRRTVSHQPREEAREKLARKVLDERKGEWTSKAKDTLGFAT